MSNEGKVVKIHYTERSTTVKSSTRPTTMANPLSSPAWQEM